MKLRSSPRTFLLTAVLTGAAVTLPGTPAIAATTISGTSTQLTTHPDDQTAPSIDGNIVVFTDFRNGLGDSDVRYIDLTNPATEVVVDDGDGNQRLNDVSGDRIAYTTPDGAGRQVVVYDIVSGNHAPLLVATPSEFDPGIDGDLVAFEQSSGGASDVGLADLFADTVITIASSGAHESNPEVGGGYVVYESAPFPGSFTKEIFLYTVGDPANSGVKIGDGLNPHTDGTTVVWNDSALDDIYVYDIASATTSAIGGPSSQTRPHVDGDIVAYDDVSVSDANIVVYHLPSGVSAIVGGPSFEELNHLDGNRVAYTSTAAGNQDIWVYEFTVEVSDDDLSKEIISGPDLDLDNKIDLVVEVGQFSATQYDFKINYTNTDGLPVLIEDTVPAQWNVQLLDDDGGRARETLANRRGKGAGATKIDWEPDPAGGMITVWAETRQKRRNGRFSPTACGALLLNKGAKAFEIDPVTLEPKVDEFGERLSPILESNQLCLAAVSDLNGDGLVRDGSGDEDGDSLTDLAEACEIGTDPCEADTDGDGVPDGVDACPLEAAVIDADGDGCEDPPSLTVFVTSGTYTGDLLSAANAGSNGLEAGDAICNELAGNASLDGTYKAWLSGSDDTDPESTFTHGTVPYVLTDGTQIASDWLDLIDATLLVPIDKDENQNFVGDVLVWTATSPNGTSDHNNGDCADWSSSSVFGMTRVGRTFFMDSRWTQWSSFSCDAPRRLYCFEQE